MAARLYRRIIVAALLTAALLAWALHVYFGVSAARAIPSAIAIVLFGHAAVLGAEFVAISRVNQKTPIPDGYPVNGSAGALIAWLVEVPSAWYTFLYAVPFLGGQVLPSGGDRDKLPVLLVHGYTCNRAVWRPFARWLAERGHAVAAPNLEPINGSIDHLSVQIHRAVADLCQRTGATQVALVGHSMGGVAIRAYLRDYGSNAAAHVVTIGSPHQGTWVARFGRSVLAGQLALDSRWLRALAGNESDQTGHLFSIIAGCHDNIIAPAAIQTIPGSRVTFFAGLGHVDLIYRHSVWRAVAASLEAKSDVIRPAQDG